MGSTNTNLENKNEGKSSRRSFIRKWGLLSLGTIFAASQMTNKMPKVHAEVLDNAESNDISKDVIRMSAAASSTDVFTSGQTAEDLANSVNGLSKSFSNALADLKDTAVAKAINAAGNTFTDVIASLATILDQSGFSKTLSAPEKVIIPAGYHDGTGYVDASSLMVVPTQTLTLSAPTNGTDCVNYAKVVTSGLMQTPTANLDISSNGTYTVTNYKTVKVNVSQGVTLGCACAVALNDVSIGNVTCGKTGYAAIATTTRSDPGVKVRTILYKNGSAMADYTISAGSGNQMSVGSQTIPVTKGDILSARATGGTVDYATGLVLTYPV